jgi:hypothetical protein
VAHREQDTRGTAQRLVHARAIALSTYGGFSYCWGSPRPGSLPRVQHPQTRAAKPTIPLSALTSVVVAATPVATWWLVGDLSEEPGISGQPPTDHMIPPPQLGETVETFLGVSAVLAAALALVALAVAAWRGAVAPRRWRVVAPLVLAGVYCGFAWRVMTAAVHGANIGGGMMLMFGVVFVPAMAAIAVGQAGTQR